MSGTSWNRRDILKFGGAAAVVAGMGLPDRVLADTATPASVGESLTMYSGQHEALVQTLVDAFKIASGITIDIRSGSDSELANQIIEEGERTKADLYISEEPSPVALLDGAGLLAPIAADSLANTDARFNPGTGNWLAYALRSRVMFYNPDLIAEDDLPASILDLTDSVWSGSFAYAPSGAFVAVTNYLINTIGDEGTLTWLQGIAANGENLLKNGAIRDAVEAGQIGFGLSNHYYWYILAKEKGVENLVSRVHWVKGQDAGGLMLASGVGVLKSSQKQDLAQQFVTWMADPQGGQKVIAEQSPQFPTAQGVSSTYDLPSLDELDPPAFDQGSLKDSQRAQELIIEAGIV